MATDIDTLMDLDPLEMTKEDIDAIIAYHRNNRAREDENGRMPRGKAPVTKGKLDITNLIKGMAKKDEPPKPRPSGLRRI